MKKLFQKLKGLALSAVPGGNLIKNLFGKAGGDMKINPEKWKQDATIDLGKIILFIAILGYLLGWWDEEKVEKVKEFSNQNIIFYI